MDMQKRYWHEMVQTKFTMYYIDFYHENSVKIDRRMNMFLAIVACGSIAGWAVWNQLAIIWACFVALSQVLNAIKPYLPYSKRVEGLLKYNNDIGLLYAKMEYDWLYVSNGKLTEDEINDLLLKYISEIIAFPGKYLVDDYLTKNEKCREKADDLTNNYFIKNFWG